MKISTKYYIEHTKLKALAILIVWTILSMYFWKLIFLVIVTLCQMRYFFMIKVIQTIILKYYKKSSKKSFI